MVVDGNPLWLVGIGAFVVICLWLLFAAVMHLERMDARRGRPDLDDDTHLPFH